MAGQLTIDTLKASSGVLATQNGMTGICKAWAHWNYNTGSVVIQSSFNVSSITRTTTGVYVVNFTTAMPDANYAIVGSGSNDNTSARAAYPMSPDNTTTNGGFTTTACTVVVASGGTLVSSFFNSIAIIGN